MNLSSLGFGTVLIFAVGVRADNLHLHGHVVDETGKPVAGASVDYFWRANGTQKGPNGTPLDLTRDEDIRLLWSHEGQMEPLEGVKTDFDGSFKLPVSRRRHAVMAMDSARERGGMVIIAKGRESEPVEIRLARLARISGSLVLGETGEKPAFSVVRAMIPENPNRPLDNFWVAQCGSLEARFEMLLPPGRYVLEALGAPGIDDGATYPAMPYPEFTINSDTRDHNFGVLQLQRPRPSVHQMEIAKADAEGSWGNYEKHYGEHPPTWHVTDVRGTKSDVTLADYRGKWVLLNFWGLSCVHCLGDDLPRLMKFYEDHASQRDKFEIIAFCTDCDNNLKTISDLDKALEPIVKHVWNGRKLPFPVLLDSTFTTMRRYGLRAYGTLLLIDPNGNLVEGDEKTLAEHLRM